MNLFRIYRTVPLSLLVAAFTLGGCSKKEEQQNSDATEAHSEGDVQLDFTPSDKDRESIDKLLSKINKKTKRFAYSEASKKANAKLFTYLAATSEDPVVVAAALQAIQSSYSHRSNQKATPDADLDKVLLKHLASEDPEILGRALTATRVALARPEPHPELSQAIVQLGAKHPKGPARHAILEAIATLPAAKRSPEAIGLLTSSLASKEPYVQSLALQALHQSLAAVEADEAVRARALELAGHEDPGVRGRALPLLSSLKNAQEHPEILEKTRAALADAHPYVRTEAALALARLGEESDIHGLAERLDDKERSTYDLKGWTRLDGRPGNLRHRVSGHTHVNSAAVHAIAKLSAGRLTLEPTDRKQPAEGLEKNLELTKAWYTKTRPQLARPPKPAPGTAEKASPTKPASAAAEQPPAKAAAAPASSAPAKAP